MAEMEQSVGSAPGTPEPATTVPRTVAGKRRGKPKRRHTIGMVLLSTALVLALVTGLGVVFAYRHLNANLTVKDPFENPAERPEDLDTGPQKPIRVLVMASDTREGEGNDIDGETGAAGSDTTILLHISADRSRAYGISIPRDSLVERPACGPNDEIAGSSSAMWNAAFSLGQEACTVEQFELNTGVRLDDTIVVDFNGFKGMVDAIGGVPMCIPQDINDPEHDIFIKGGEDRLLDGEESLDYVRVRAIGTGSDIDRVTRQQHFIAAMVNKIVSAGTLTRPDRVLGVLNSATKSLTLSPGLGDLGQLSKLALSLNGVGLDQIQFLTVPWEVPESDPNRVAWTEEADEMWRKIARDKPLSAELSEDAVKAGEKKTAKPSGDSGDAATGGTDGEPRPSATANPVEEPSEDEIARKAAMGICA